MIGAQKIEKISATLKIFHHKEVETRAMHLVGDDAGVGKCSLADIRAIIDQHMSSISPESGQFAATLTLEPSGVVPSTMHKKIWSERGCVAGVVAIRTL